MKHCNQNSLFIFIQVKTQMFDFDLIFFCLFQISVYKTQLVETCFYLVHSGFQIIAYV